MYRCWLRTDQAYSGLVPIPRDAKLNWDWLLSHLSSTVTPPEPLNHITRPFSTLEELMNLYWIFSLYRIDPPNSFETPTYKAVATNDIEITAQVKSAR